MMHVDVADAVLLATEREVKTQEDQVKAFERTDEFPPRVRDPSTRLGYIPDHIRQAAERLRRQYCTDPADDTLSRNISKPASPEVATILPGSVKHDVGLAETEGAYMVEAKSTVESTARAGESVKALLSSAPIVHDHAPSSEIEERSGLEGMVFPVRTLACLPSFVSPALEMSALVADLLAHQNYHLVRTRYCYLSICMNLKGAQAPAFRTKLNALPKRGDDVAMLMHKDRLLIDYHWCHASGMVLSIDEPDHAALFSAPDFNFSAAWRLAGRKWRSRFRAAEVLCLTRHQQFQTVTLHDEEVANQLKKIGAGWHESGGKTTSKRAKFNRALGEWAERDRRIHGERRSYELLWLTREMLGHGASDQGIAKLHALAVGGPERDRTSIRDRLKRLDKNVCVK